MHVGGNLTLLHECGNGTMNIGVTLLLSLLSFDDWSQISSEFQASAAGTSVGKFAIAVQAVVRDNSARAVKLMLGGISARRVEAYWILITGLAKISSAEGVEELEKAILAKGGDAALKRDLMMSLQFNSSEPANGGLLKIAAEGTPDLQVTAMDELVRRGLRDSIPVLIRISSLEKKKNSSEVARQARMGLINLTGTDLGSSENWTAWWEKNKETFKVGDPPHGERDTVVAMIKRNRLTDYEELKKGKQDEVVVLLGDYDGVQDVVEGLKIPHLVIARATLGRQDLSKCKALIVNCTAYKSERLKKGDLEKIRQFVASGGYLFTSDWGMADVLEDAFPGYIQRGAETQKMNVAIFPKKGSTGHPFLREVFAREEEDPQDDGPIEKAIDRGWEIDAQSYTLAVDPKKVVVLVEAPELQANHQFGAVAVTFSPGASAASIGATGGVYEELSQIKGGKVLHVLSHFSKQKNKNDGYTLQNMLLNFLIEAKDRRKLLEKK